MKIDIQEILKTVIKYQARDENSDEYIDRTPSMISS